MKTTSDKAGLDRFDPAETPLREATHFRRILRARDDVSSAQDRLRDVVREARAAGETWNVIGAALDISRQAAQQRFGE